MSDSTIWRQAKFLLGDIGACRYQRWSNCVSVDVLQTGGKGLAAQFENAADIKYD
jgi:hypothetical protein